MFSMVKHTLMVDMTEIARDILRICRELKQNSAQPAAGSCSIKGKRQQSATDNSHEKVA